MGKSYTYLIVVQGYISDRLAESLSEMEIKSLDNGNTAIKGLIKDQAALMGVIYRIRDFGLTLLLVKKT